MGEGNAAVTAQEAHWEGRQISTGSSPSTNFGYAALFL